MKSDDLEKLFLLYYNEALLYTLTLTKDKDLAEDIVSEAFYKALESVDDSINNFKYWLLRVCRNMFYNHVKRKKRYAELPEDYADEREHVLETIIRDEKYQALYHAIDLLPSSQKEVITLFYFEDMTINEIGKLIEKSTTATKVLLFRARENLKKLLEV